jgi:hypothetical protein
MAEKRTFDERTHDTVIREGEHDSDTHKTNEPRERYVDPAEEVMNSNPNISPPIHPLPN